MSKLRPARSRGCAGLQSVAFTENAPHRARSAAASLRAWARVLQLSRDLGVHLARRGVRVNALVLGPIETPQLQALFANIGPEEIERRFVHYPMGRFGTLEEMAGTVAYLASDDSGFVTGAAFPLDGGITSAFTVPPSPQSR